MKQLIALLALTLWLAPLATASDDGHDHDHGHDHGQAAATGSDREQHHDPELIVLDENQRAMLDLRLETLRARPGAVRALTVPAEITSNQYRTWVVPVRIDSQVLARRVSLGQHVKKGDAIATLFSPVMAELQSDLATAADQWRRVAQLGRRTVGNQRYLDARGRYQTLRARALGYGLGEADLAALEKGEAEEGVYTLRAPDDGLVLTDAFQQGQWLTAGRPLVTLVDESTLWAEAALPPRPGLTVPDGTLARVSVDATEVVGEVIQSGHRLDPVTRTLSVRVAVPNQDHLLHPGMFADVALELPLPDDTLSLPEEALTRGPDGDWQVFVEQQPGRYRAQEITVLDQLEGRRRISGLEPGSRVVTRGAFFLAGEQAKSGFQVHQH